MVVEADPGFAWRHPIQVVADGKSLPAGTIRVPIMASSRVRIHAKLSSGTGSVSIQLGNKRQTASGIYAVPAAEVLALSTSEASWESDQIYGEPYLYLTISGTGVVDYFDVCQI